MGDFKVFFGPFFQLQAFRPVLGIPGGCNFVGKLNSQILEGPRCFGPHHLSRDTDGEIHMASYKVTKLSDPTKLLQHQLILRVVYHIYVCAVHVVFHTLSLTFSP